MIRVLTTSFNCQDWIFKTIKSLQLQKTQEWKCYITDDLSTDNSVNVIKECIKGDNRFELIQNTKKFYQVGNYWQVSQKEEIQEEDIFVTLDGDDWLPNDSVFERVLEYYKKDVYVTCGQFVCYHGDDRYTEGFTAPPNVFSELRSCRWQSSHLRTFKAHIFRKIKYEDLREDENNFWSMAGDLAFMFPMLEMAGEKRVLYTNDINMVYNAINPLSEHKVSVGKQNTCAQLIRNKKPYALLS